MKTKPNQAVSKIRLTIPLAPPSANRLWRNAKGHSYLSPMALRYYRAVAWQVFGVRIPPDWDAIAVRIWVRQARRAGDVDNLIKPVLDALTRAGVWVDDKIVASVHCERLDPKDGAPYTYIELTRARGGLYASGAPW